MKLFRYAVAAALAVGLLSLPALSQKKSKRLLFIGATKGFQHDSTSYAAGTLWKLGHD